MAFTVIVMLLTVIFSGVFSGLETGIYRLSRLRLRLGKEKGDLRYVLLSKAMQDSSALLLTLLIANNVANYLATSTMTYLFLTMATEGIAELLATSLVAPILFVFSESLPKNLFLYRADFLTPYLAPFLFGVHRVLTWSGVVPFLRLIARSFAWLIGTSIPPKRAIVSSQSHHVRTILRDTQEEGLLSHVQAEMIDRIANIPNLRLSAVMVPTVRVQSVSFQADRAALLDELRRHAFTRLPVWRDSPGNLIGFVNIYEVLGCDEDFASLERFVRPLRTLDVDTLVIDAINVMRHEHVEVVLVTRRRGSREMPAGIVTMKDLVEELMGELTEW